ncbi:MAG: hypothetical protein ACYCZA_05975 [Thiobacillus sp.]
MLAIALPLQGYAQFVLPNPPCPMEQAAMMDGADTAAHDCCNDADTAAKTGKACKSGQSCPSMGQILPMTELGVLTQDPASSVRFPRLADKTFTFDPAATWRPPAQL